VDGDWVLTRKVALVGLPSSGKTLFVIGVTLALAASKVGRMSPIHPDYCRIADEAVAGISPRIATDASDASYQLRLRQQRTIEFVEKVFTEQEFIHEPKSIAKALLKYDGLLLFLGRRSTGRGVKHLEQEVGGDAAVSTTATRLAPVLDELFRLWKLRRSVGFVMFVLTNTSPGQFSPADLKASVERVYVRELRHLKKRKVICSFHCMELIGEGIDLRGGLQDALDEILKRFA